MKEPNAREKNVDDDNKYTLYREWKIVNMLLIRANGCVHTQIFFPSNCLIDSVSGFEKK